jgi:hypothetical protein
VGDIAGKSLHVLLLAAGGYALAWTVGFILIPFPGGIGPRELALIAVLSPVMAPGPALVVALMSRVVTTIGDLTWAAVAAGVGRKQRREALEETRAALAADQTLAASETSAADPVRPEQDQTPADRDRVPAQARSSAGHPGTPSSTVPDRPPVPPSAAGSPPPAR